VIHRSIYEYNTASAHSGGASCGSNVNSIVFFNHASIGANWSGTIKFQNSCATPLPPGSSNITADPGLASLTHLSVGAPCVGAGSNADADWMTDLQEYWADTIPTNGLSFFPNIALTNAPPGVMSFVVTDSSTGRVYGVYANTNLLQAPHTWTLIPPEKTGTAASFTLTATNNLPAQNYRTGVRLP